MLDFGLSCAKTSASRRNRITGTQLSNDCWAHVGSTMFVPYQVSLWPGPSDSQVSAVIIGHRTQDNYLQLAISPKSRSDDTRTIVRCFDSSALASGTRFLGP